MTLSAQTSSKWPKVRFGDVVRNVDESVRDPQTCGLERYVGLEHIDPESLHIQRSGLIAEGTTFTRRFRKGQVLFGKRRAYQRKVAVAEFDGLCSSDILVFEPKDDRLLPELLPFICQTESFFEHALDTSAGSLSPRTKFKELARYEFPLPPLDEQRRIAEILWAADKATIMYMNVYEKSQDARNLISDDIFENPGKYYPRCIVRKERLGQIVVYASDGPFGSKLKTEHYSSTGARVIRLQNIGAGRFLDHDKSYIPFDYYSNLKRYWVLPGDIIVAGLGDETHPVGRACMIPDALGPAINKADCFCLRANTSIISQEFLFYFLNSSFARVQVDQIAQGTTRLRINVGNLKTIFVPLFEDFRIQNAICEILRDLDSAEIKTKNHIGACRSLASSLREQLIPKN